MNKLQTGSGNSEMKTAEQDKIRKLNEDIQKYIWQKQTENKALKKLLQSLDPQFFDSEKAETDTQQL